MNTDNLTNETIRRYIPNVLTEVEGETPLADKLAPFIASAKVWLETEFLGSEDFLSEAHNDFALKILVVKAFADAVPSLDLVVTPTGMAVVSTDNLAPASKERVERLNSSLRDYVKVNLYSLVKICKGYPEWIKSPRGQYFCSTFASISDCKDFQDSIFGTFDIMRGKCILAEASMSRECLGFRLMDRLRFDYHTGLLQPYCRLYGFLHHAVLKLYEAEISNSPECSWHNLVWQVCRPIVNELNLCPEYKGIWEAEMGDKFNTSGFVNDIKGGFYF